MAVAAWQECVKDVQRLSTYPSAGDPRFEPAKNSILSFTLKEASTLSHATVGKLVDLQVPGQLSTIAADAAREDPRSPVAFTAATALARLLGPLDKRCETLLGDSLWLQLDNSGLFQQLPQLMAAAAQDLQAAADAGGSLAHNSYELCCFANTLSQIVSTVQLLCREKDRACVGLKLAPALMLVVTAVFKSVTLQLQQPTAPLLALGSAVYNCCLASLKTLATLMAPAPTDGGGAGGRWTRPEVVALLRCDGFAPALCLVSAAVVFAETGKWEEGRAAQGRRYSTSTSDPAFVRQEAQTLGAWEQIGSNMQRCVSPCVGQLLALLSVSPTTVVWAGGLLCHSEVTPAESLGQIIRLILPQALRARQSDAAGQLQLQQLCAFLPSVWMPWAVSKGTDAGSLERGVAVSMHSLAVWAQVAATQQAAAQRQTGGQAAPGLSDNRLPPMVACEVLPQVLKVMRAILQQRQPGVHSHLAVTGCLSTLCLLLKVSGLPDDTTAAAAAAAAAATVAAAAAPAGQSAQHSSAAAASASASAGPSASSAESIMGCRMILQLVEKHRVELLQQLDSAVRYFWGCAVSWDKVAMCVSHESLSQLSGLVAHHTSVLAPSSRTSMQPPPAFYSLLSSMLKFSTVYVAAPGPPHCANEVSSAVGRAAVVVASRFSRLVDLSSVPTASAAAQGQGGDAAASSSSSGGGGGSSSAHNISLSSVLPCVVLWGRRCLYLSAQLLRRCEHAADAFFPVFDPMLPHCAFLRQEIQPWQAWLSQPSVVQHLSAVQGLTPADMVKSLQRLDTAVDKAVSGARGRNSITATHLIKTLGEKLAAVGAEFTSVAVSSMCGNPACDNTSGPSDIALVSGPGCVCGGCLTARYCSKACQRVHWKAGHKPVCKALAAAAAAAKAAAAEEAGAGASADAASASASGHSQPV